MGIEFKTKRELKHLNSIKGSHNRIIFLQSLLTKRNQEIKYLRKELWKFKHQPTKIQRVLMRKLSLKCPQCWRVFEYEIKSEKQKHVLCKHCNTTFVVEMGNNERNEQRAPKHKNERLSRKNS